MPEKRKDVDNDGFREPLYRPENIGEAADVAEELGLSESVHSVESDGETFFVPGESGEEFDMVEEQMKDVERRF